MYRLSIHSGGEMESGRAGPLPEEIRRALSKTFYLSDVNGHTCGMLSQCNCEMELCRAQSIHFNEPRRSSFWDITHSNLV
jgi:hypothetical protein